MIRLVLPALRLLARPVALAGLALALLAPPAAAVPRGCAVPHDMVEEARPLQAASRALELGALRILVIGSASVVQAGTAEAATTWPSRLETALGRRYSEARINVLVRGSRGASVTDNLQRLKDALRQETPALVIWQAGTVELSRGMDPHEMTEVMREGLEAIRRAGADLIVMDQQYSRFLRANANVEPYREKLRLLAASAGAALFPRYDLMRHWVETGALDLERVARGDRAAALERLNGCLGEAVAQMVIRGLSEAR
ncbi:SGNH/GDSL hydrolase family protein [Roseococcus thiosulfatophilus]|uniref:SGNH/GDSL hydrolase family protein n=1 Tax=Roseococcus thiosulfatophilus TaxID=35813 RepID=UPI001A8CBD55|nr:GDSL-type esterase/lipase family protein [Roseococcus thiosulfatophilus]